MSPERIEGYKFFVNKIWNAAKLTFASLEDYDDKNAVTGTESLPDKWIKTKLNNAIEEVTESLDEYRFNDAAAVIYRFIWHEFCDWYLELSKPALYGKVSSPQRQAAQRTLHDVFKTTLKLLHPFMPFVTEELWQVLTESNKTSIMISPFPTSNKAWKDENAEKEMQFLMDVITSIRNIRGEMKIPPSRKLQVLISADDRQVKNIMQNGKDYIINMANLETLRVETDLVEPKGMATGVVGSTKIFVPLAGIVDTTGEKARLQKEITKIEKDLQQCSKKLANRDFLEKAAEAVIKKEEEKLKEFKERHAALEAALKKLQEIIK